MIDYIFICMVFCFFETLGSSHSPAASQTTLQKHFHITCQTFLEFFSFLKISFVETSVFLLLPVLTNSGPAVLYSVLLGMPSFLSYFLSCFLDPIFYIFLVYSLNLLGNIPQELCKKGSVGVADLRFSKSEHILVLDYCLARHSLLGYKYFPLGVLKALFTAYSLKMSLLRSLIFLPCLYLHPSLKVLRFSLSMPNLKFHHNMVFFFLHSSCSLYSLSPLI